MNVIFLVETRKRIRVRIRVRVRVRVRVDVRVWIRVTIRLNLPRRQKTYVSSPLKIFFKFLKRAGRAHRGGTRRAVAPNFFGGSRPHNSRRQN